MLNTEILFSIVGHAVYLKISLSEFIWAAAAWWLPQEISFSLLRGPEVQDQVTSRSGVQCSPSSAEFSLCPHMVEMGGSSLGSLS